jgi:DNA-directed RNA polymerase subunit RPC12/RpoP
MVKRKRKRPIKAPTKELREERRQKAREYHLMRIYGMTQAQYDELLKKQGHKCFVCLRHENEFKTRLAVDHDHKTGEIRGLLCNYCNHRVIGRNRDPEIMKRVWEYLSQGTGWFVPKKKKTKRKKNAR